MQWGKTQLKICVTVKKVKEVEGTQDVHEKLTLEVAHKTKWALNQAKSKLRSQKHRKRGNNRSHLKISTSKKEQIIFPYKLYAS